MSEDTYQQEVEKSNPCFSAGCIALDIFWYICLLPKMYSKAYISMELHAKKKKKNQLPETAREEKKNNFCPFCFCMPDNDSLNLRQKSGYFI